MTPRTPPFAAFEWMIAWRYLRARRAEGGVSTMTWISLVGVALAVFALIATLAVRSGFRAEFVDTVLGANAHATIYYTGTTTPSGQMSRAIEDYADLTRRLAAVPGVSRAAPLIKGQVMATNQGRSAGVEVFGIRAEDLMAIPRIAHSDRSRGDIARFALQRVAQHVLHPDYMGGTAPFLVREPDGSAHRVAFADPRRGLSSLLLAELDPTVALVDGGARIRRGHTNGPIRVALPDGYLDHLDDMTVPDDAREMAVSGG